MTKCPLCEQYYGPFSMERHLETDHALMTRTDVYESGYSDGFSAGAKATPTRGPRKNVRRS